MRQCQRNHPETCRDGWTTTWCIAWTSDVLFGLVPLVLCREEVWIPEGVKPKHHLAHHYLRHPAPEKLRQAAQMLMGCKGKCNGLIFKHEDANKMLYKYQIRLLCFCFYFVLKLDSPICSFIRLKVSKEGNSQ